MYEGILRHRKPPVHADNVGKLFDSTAPAPAVPECIPKGQYEADWIGIRIGESSTAKPRITLTFEVIEGEFSGKKVWIDLYLTDKAMPRTKRELAKLGIESSADWLLPVPRWIRCSLRVVVETGDDKKQRNKIADFKVISFDQELPDPFSPDCDGGDA